MPKISLLLVDDHQLVLEAWTFMLNSDERFQVLGTARNAESALTIVRETRPNIILCDINLTPVDGVSLTSMIRKISPGARIIAVSVHDIPAYARKMIQAGAAGYVTKNSPVEELKQAIIEVNAGKKYICNEIKEKLAITAFTDDSEAAVAKLSRRELDIIHALKEGLSSKEIAMRLHIAWKTVEVHRYNILKKLQVPNTAALVNYINLRGL